MQQRPISVTIFGILNIGFGLLGVVSLLFYTMLMSGTNMTAGNPILKQMYENPAYVTWMKLSMPLNGIAAIVLLAGGIGLLCLQNWARLISIGYGIYAILMGIFGGLVMLKVILPMMAGAAHGAPGIIMIIAIFSSFFGIVIGLVYPILLLIFMTRPKVVAAFGLLPPLPVA